MKRFLGFLLLIGLVFLAAEAEGQNLINPLPTSNANFMTTLSTFLSEEDAERYDELAAGVVISGGLHAAGAGLTKTPLSLIAYADGWRITETGSIVYPSNSTCVVIAGKATTGNVASFTRVTGTHYLIDCTGGARPVLPNDSVWLMEVTTDGSSVTAVEDLRGRRPTAFIDAGEYESLAAAVTAIGSDSYTLLVQSHLYVGGNLTIPANVTLEVARGGQIEVGAGFILTLAQPIVAGRYRIFSSGTTVRFQTYLEVFPEWWGAITDDAGDDVEAIEAAVSSLPSMVTVTNCGMASCGGVVSLAAGRYNLTVTLDINPAPTPTTLVEGVTIRGVSREATFLSYTGSGTAIALHGDGVPNVASGLRLENFRLNDTGGSGIIGISLEYLMDVRISNVYVGNFYSAAPSLRVLESIATGGSQDVDIAANGDGIWARYTTDLVVENSFFEANNIGFYCYENCDNGILGSGNTFVSASGTENFSVALIGPISRFHIESNHFDSGLADGEGEIFIWNVDGVDVANNQFDDGDAAHWVYANALTSGPRNHFVGVVDNYFDVHNWAESDADLAASVYFRNTSGGQIRGNLIEGSPYNIVADIELGSETEKIVVEENQAYLSAATGAYALGSARQVSIADSTSSAIVIGAFGDPLGQVSNPSIYVPGGMISARGGFQENRWNLATDSSFETGTAVLTLTAGVLSSVSTTGWHSSEGVSVIFPLASTTITDRVEFDNTATTCTIGDYFTVSFAAENGTGTTAQRDDFSFAMAGSENLATFTPQLDTNWNRYWFTTNKCIGAGAVELRAFQNTAQSGVIALSVDAVQIERNVESPGAFIPTRASGLDFEGLIATRGGMVLPARIETISGNISLNMNDGTLLLITNSGATTRNITPVGDFPVGYVVTVYNVETSLGGIVFDPTGIARRLQPDTSLTAMWDGTNWIRIGESGTSVYVHNDLAGILAQYSGGDIVYCSNCDEASDPCTTGGGGDDGAIAYRRNIGPRWVCP